MSADRSFYHVDSSEEIASVLRGVKMSQGIEVAVVLPPDPRVFRNDVNLRLLRIYAKEAGKNLVLVSQDPGVVRLASALGLEVYVSSALAWRKEGRMESAEITEPIPVIAGSEPPTKGQGPKELSPGERRSPKVSQRLAALFIAIIALGALLAVLREPVTVVVTPYTDQLEEVVELPLVLHNEGAGTALSIPLRDLSIPVEVSSQRLASGRRTIGIQAAQGTVLFFNDTNSAIQVPAGTVITTNGGVRFTTLASVSVPPRKVDFLMQVAVGITVGQAEALVRAEDKGVAGNVAAGRVTQLPNGPAALRVTNPEPMYGGADRQETYVTDADLKGLQGELANKIVDAGINEVQKEVGSRLLIESSVQVETTETVTTPERAGQVGNELRMVLKGTAQAQYIDEADILAAAMEYVIAILPPETAISGTPTIKAIQILPETKGNGRGNVAVNLAVPVQIKIDQNSVAQALAGKTLEEGRQSLASQGLVASIDVQGKVGKRLPQWKTWIKVIVADPIERPNAMEALVE